MSIKQKVWICIDVLILIVLYFISSTDYVWREKEIHLSNIVFITDSPRNASALNLEAGAEKAAQRYHADLKFLSLEDYTAQKVDVQTLVERELQNGCDGIVLQCNSYKKTEEILQKIPIGLPVILYDTKGESPRIKSFVGMHKEETLQKILQNILQIRKNGENVLLVSQKTTGENVIQFQEALEEMLQRNDIETKSVSLANPQEAETLLNGLEQQGGSILFTADTKMLEALAEAKQENTISLCGVGWSSRIRTELEKGHIQWSLVENHYISGYESVRKAAEFLNRKNLEEEKLFTESVIVTQRNLYQKETEFILFPFV